MIKKRSAYTPRQVHGFWSGWGWFVVPDWNLTIAAPPKAGSSSLKQYFYESDMDNVTMVPRYKVNPDSEIFFVVRNPIDRFMSLWRGKCRDKDNISDYRVHGMQPDQLMDHIEAGNRDIHWALQDTLLNGLDANLIRLENLRQWFNDRGYGELPKANSTDGDVDIDDSLKNRI
jgi:hypothetical protein